MSKHKRFHGPSTRAQQRKAYAFFHAHNPQGSASGLAKRNAITKKLAERPAPAPAGRETTPPPEG